MSEPAQRGRFAAWFHSAPRRVEEARDVGLPGPDLANFPNSSLTLPGWRSYLETTPFNMASATHYTPASYDWELFFRVGLTDHIEARVYTSGLTVTSSRSPRQVGFSPLTFDTKLHLAQHSWRYFNFSVGLEAYVQTRWGSPALSPGVQYAVNVLADHSLPWRLSYEWNLGFLRAVAPTGQQVFLPTFQAALQRPVTDAVAVFVQSFRNAASLPRAGLTKGLHTGRDRGTVFGAGAQWIASKRWALFGSFNVGFGALVPTWSGSAGAAFSF